MSQLHSRMSGYLNVQRSKKTPVRLAFEIADKTYPPRLADRRSVITTLTALFHLRFSLMIRLCPSSVHAMRCNLLASYVTVAADQHEKPVLLAEARFDRGSLPRSL